MYQNEYDRTIEKMKTYVELMKDYSNYIRCKSNLDNFDRPKAWECLQDMIREYEVQINVFGGFIDGKRVIKGVLFESFSNNEIYEQLKYIYVRIPVYVLMQSGEEELAKNIYDWKFAI